MATFWVMRSAAGVVLSLNFCMYVIVSAIAGSVLNEAIDNTYREGFVAAVGNEATRFFVMFALIAGVMGCASCVVGVNHVKVWTSQSSIATTVSSVTAWSLTLLAMGFACKEIHLGGRNSRLRALEAMVIILSGTKLLYMGIIYLGYWAGEYSTYTYQDTYPAKTTVIADPEKEARGSTLSL
eukprot:TRINITY_DN4169_c0_g1_i3.p1 TRINITY_DN4169_c0_g1~~TRINITY_DN4169_c0_g1_i3.p1  ORF type:complete len:182 (+),score=3.75 TRINITY_DN4169_c0_g1_i3:94-639(+)